MPSKKKSNLSQSSRGAKKNKENRSNELEKNREARLLSQRIRAAVSRSLEDREVRLTADRERLSQSRAKETPTQRETRLMNDRERHTLLRVSETFCERDNRLRADHQRHILSRATETTNERETRLTADQQRHTVSRGKETETERQNRLKIDIERHVQLRSTESASDREVRLTVDRERHADTRATETANERQCRLIADRQRHSLARVSEATSIILSQHPDSSQDNVQDNIVLNDELPWVNKVSSGFSYNTSINYSDFSGIGEMTVTCTNCQALKFRKESNGFCCSSGKVRLDGFHDPPELLKSLLNGEHPESKHFLDNIRTFNSSFQMTSFGAKQITEGHFMPTFKIQGQVYHLIGSLLPEAEPKFLQIYFVSNYNEQVSVRNKHFPILSVNLITLLQNMLHQVNPYVRDFKAALESIQDRQNNDYKLVISADRRPAGKHRGCYNAPSANEVAVVLVDEECDRRDIVLKSRDNRLQRINETHRAYDSLQYPLIYCHGEDGYNFSVNQVDPTTGEPRCNKKTSALQFYCYLLQLRSNQFVYLQRYRGLFSQFIVDMYAKIETERLAYIRNNQRQLRAEDYVHLRDAMQQDNSPENLGRLVILPSTFTGSPRYMHERTQDAFCYVRKYGRPDLFITFTTNPKWEEITHELLPGQSCYDRHDIIARVFHLKLKLMIDLLTKEHIFGEAQCHMYSVEWQKRGLPHAHMLLWLVQKVRPNDINNLIRAEFPDPTEDPALHDIVKSHMVHGPCGALNKNSPCMQDAHCTKRYPRTLLEQTITGEDGYPLYRRRSPQQGEFTAEIKVRNQKVVLDNRWVVPYSPVLSKTFKAHINVEMCNSVESIKYICKYVNKGSDQAMFGVRNNERDEVTRFQSGRYISSSEAAWRIFSFSIHERYPPVIHLDVHIEGGQRIFFNSKNLAAKLENPRQTTLLAFFRLCELDDFAKTLLYDEVPSYYTYDKQQGVFNRRKRGRAVEDVPCIFKEHIIGRVYNVHPNNAECYYLRLLLHTVKGPTSFTELRTVDGIVHSTYQAACRARHMIDDDHHWDDALAEACISDSSHRLRHLFCIMLVFFGLSDPVQLWHKYKDKLSEDFLRDIRFNNGTLENVFNHCLVAIQEIVTSMGGNSLIQYGFPPPTLDELHVNSKYISETNYDPVELAENLRNCVPCLTVEQRVVFDRVCHSVSNNLGEMLFLDAPGGTGKTFVTKVILTHIRHDGKIALAVASSGIAATLLPNGKTAHSVFKIPIKLDCVESPVCAIARNIDEARVLRDCFLIVWDECTMAHRKSVEAVSRTLQDIRQDYRPMGGVTVLFCGDFRQTLPVVPRGTKCDELRACLKSSNLWRNITKMHLSMNIRVQIGCNRNGQEFSNLLLKIGEGTYPEENGKVNLPDSLCRKANSVEDLISFVYDNPSEIKNCDNSWLCERAILTPRNDQVLAINRHILAQVDGESKVYTSINSVLEQDDVTNFPVEFLIRYLLLVFLHMK